MPEAPEDSFEPATRAAWRRWLEKNHSRAEGVWLVTLKKSANVPPRRERIDYDAAVEEALCFGWVDSLPRKLDDTRSMLYFAPRKPRSGWSRPNKERVARLVAAGLMAPAGLAKIEGAKADGSWSKLDEVEDLVIPDDLRAALKANPSATKHFDAFPRSVKRGILEWITSAKRPETRAKRVLETATLAARNERANQWRPDKKA
jgi:uncharacterized protein YdeI (YjbR/CyaY-like superfamily)